ncbi:MAG: twin-arginine translocase TatA/TatE family subunit [candidate division WOR-3 bacterium]
MFRLGWTEILLIVLLILLLFGARRIPEVMRALGRGVHELKKGMQGLEGDDKTPVNSDKTTQDKTEQGPKV